MMIEILINTTSIPDNKSSPKSHQDRMHGQLSQLIYPDIVKKIKVLVKSNLNSLPYNNSINTIICNLN